MAQDNKTTEEVKKQTGTTETPETTENFFRVNGGLVYGKQTAHKFTKEELEDFYTEEEQEEYTDWKEYDIKMVADSYDIKPDGTIQLITNYIDEEEGLLKASIRIHKQFSKKEAEALLFKDLTFTNPTRTEIKELDFNGNPTGKVTTFYIAEDVEATNKNNKTNFDCNVYTQILVSFAKIIKPKKGKKKLPTLKLDAVLENGTRRDLFSVLILETTLTNNTDNLPGNMVRINNLEKAHDGTWVSKTDFNIL